MAETYHIYKKNNGTYTVYKDGYNYKILKKTDGGYIQSLNTKIKSDSIP